MAHPVVTSEESHSLAECARLESVLGGNSHVGSNPTSSAGENQREGDG